MSEQARGKEGVRLAKPIRQAIMDCKSLEEPFALYLNSQDNYSIFKIYE